MDLWLWDVGLDYVLLLPFLLGIKLKHSYINAQWNALLLHVQFEHEMFMLHLLYDKVIETWDRLFHFVGRTSFIAYTFQQDEE